jgi:hypothetical protein
MNLGNMITSWKTTLFGAGGIGTALWDVVYNLAMSTPDKINWNVDIPIILAGIGLLFAKDSNVTGGTTVQN